MDTDSKTLAWFFYLSSPVFICGFDVAVAVSPWSQRPDHPQMHTDGHRGNPLGLAFICVYLRSSAVSTWPWPGLEKEGTAGARRWTQIKRVLDRLCPCLSAFICGFAVVVGGAQGKRKKGVRDLHLPSTHCGFRIADCGLKKPSRDPPSPTGYGRAGRQGAGMPRLRKKGS